MYFHLCRLVFILIWFGYFWVEKAVPGIRDGFRLNKELFKQFIDNRNLQNSPEMTYFDEKQV